MRSGSPSPTASTTSTAVICSAIPTYPASASSFSGIWPLWCGAIGASFHPAIFEGLDPEDLVRLRYLCVLVRLAVLIQHPRNQEPPPSFTLRGAPDKLTIEFDEGWLDDRPLTLADLDNEREYLAKQNFELEIVGG